MARQGEQIDPAVLPAARPRRLRDRRRRAPDRAAAIAALLPYAETDTLCYRADPDEPLYRRQQELWEPLLTAAEARHGVRLERISGDHPPPAARRRPSARLRRSARGAGRLHARRARTLAPLAASLVIALAALEPDADPAALFAAANCEEDWQAELWGRDAEAERAARRRLAAFEAAVRFARLARSSR